MMSTQTQTNKKKRVTVKIPSRQKKGNTNERQTPKNNSKVYTGGSTRTYVPLDKGQEFNGTESMFTRTKLKSTIELSPQTREIIRDRIRRRMFTSLTLRIPKDDINNVIRKYQVNTINPAVREILQELQISYTKIGNQEVYMPTSRLLKIKQCDIDTCIVDMMYSCCRFESVSQIIECLKDNYGVTCYTSDDHEVVDIDLETIIPILRRNKIERDITGFRTKTHPLKYIRQIARDQLNELGFDNGKDFYNAFFNLTGVAP